MTLKRFVEFDTSNCKFAMISKGTATSVIEPPELPWEGDAASTVRDALRSSPDAASTVRGALRSSPEYS